MKDIFEFLKEPDGTLILCVWMHFRLKRIEDAHANMSSQLGIKPLPRRRPMSLGILLLVLLLVALAIAAVGCGSINWNVTGEVSGHYDSVTNRAAPLLQPADGF